MRRLTSVLPLVGLLAAAVPAQAKPVCFTEAEAKAEQAIRLHTDLMVIGLTCGEATAPDQPSLFARYREFTDRHQTAVRSWEKALIGHFKRVGKGSATKNFDSYRTSLANETSRRAIALSNPVFCAAFVPLAEKALSLDPAALTEEMAKHSALLRVASLPRCDRPMPSLRVAQAGAPAPAAAAPAR